MTTAEIPAILDLLLAHFETIAEAPGGVARLRQLILQLAVQGRLVAQDPSDEPASVLLERIRAEREAMVRKGAIGRSRPAPSIQLEEIPYAIPVNWQWIRIAELGHDWGQKVPDTRFTYIDVAAVDNDRGKVSDNPAILEPEDAPSRARKIVKQGTVIYGTVRPYLLNIAIIDCVYSPEPIASTAFAIIHPHTGIYNRYVLHYFRSQPFVEYVASQMKGMAYPAINDGQFFNGLFPLPPLAEQRRIVERVDGLMALCDDLEAKQARRRAERRRIGDALADDLLAARDPAEVAAAWARLRDAFDVLYDAPESVAKLRQAILHLAFQGRLTCQMETDESASLLLQRMQTETVGAKQRKSEKIKAKTEVAGPFNIPSMWSWAVLEVLCDQIGDIDHKMPKAVSLGVPFLSAKDLKDDGTLDFSDPKHISEEDFIRLSRKILPRRDDIVYSRIGARLGKARLVEVDTRFLISYSCCLIRPKHQYIDKKYLQLFLDSRLALSQAHSGTQSIGVPDLGLGEIKGYKVPVAPLAEQRRIVARVDELMALCDDLEAKLREERAAAERFSEALCAAAGGGTEGREPRAKNQEPTQGRAALPAAPTSQPAAHLTNGHRAPTSGDAPRSTVDGPPSNRAPLHQAVLDLGDAAGGGGDYALLRELLAEQGALTNGDVQEALGVDAASAREWLRQLVADGLARVEGQKRGTRYVRVG